MARPKLNAKMRACYNTDEYNDLSSEESSISSVGASTNKGDTIPPGVDTMRRYNKRANAAGAGGLPGSDTSSPSSGMESAMFQRVGNCNNVAAAATVADRRPRW